MNAKLNQYLKLWLVVVMSVTLGLAPNVASANRVTVKIPANAAHAGMEVDQAGFTRRVSVSSDGTPANNSSFSASISADGRFVAFDSWASNLVSNDTNKGEDIYIHDLHSGQTTLISVASDGSQGIGASWAPSVSDDGRFVAFVSQASNLVADDTNGMNDIFVHDRETGQTARVSVASDGSQGDLTSWSPSISADGRFVGFASNARNLVVGDTNGYWDVFVHELETGLTTRVSVADHGMEPGGMSDEPAISATGRFVAFSSWSTLVDGDTNGEPDIFVHDRETEQTTLISVASDGTQGNWESSAPSISADGRFVAFSSYASNLVTGDTNEEYDVFLHDRETGLTTRVSVASDGTEGNDVSIGASISASGRFIAFHSWADNLVNGDTNKESDVFVHDRLTGQTWRVSVASDATQGDNSSEDASISADGGLVAFQSYANNLVSDDTNLFSEIFVNEREWKIIYLPLLSR